jgi:hypothetical protein
MAPKWRFSAGSGFVKAMGVTVPASPSDTAEPPHAEFATFTAARVHRAVRGGALDFLRFLASLLIVLYHFGAEGPMRIERFHQVFSRGFLATDFS